MLDSLSTPVKAQLLLTALRNVRMRAAGDVAGHEFHGNQYAFHGTSEENANAIKTGGFTASAGKNGQLLGEGVYLTGQRHVAEGYGGKVLRVDVSHLKVKDFKSETAYKKFLAPRVKDWEPLTMSRTMQKLGYDAVRIDKNIIVAFDAKKLKALARHPESAIHAAADAHYKPMLLAVSYGFLRGKKAYKSGGVDAAVKAIRTALLESLPPVLAKVYVAGGNAGAGMLPKVRAASNPEGINQYTHGGGTTVMDVHHGSAAKFDSFDSSHAGSAKDAGYLGKGTYFTTDKNAVAKDAHQYQAKVTLNNPLRVEVPDFKTDKRDVVREALGLPKGKNTIGSDATTHSAEVTQALKARGHDGVIVDYSKSGYRHQEVMVMHDHAISMTKYSQRSSMRTLAPFNIRFDVSSPEAIKWAREHTSKIADDISQTSKDRINEAVAQALEGDGLDAAYDDILAAVGDEARADMIARTETMWAANEGQQQGWEQAVEDGLLPSDAKAEWIATSGCCDDCDAMDGETRPIDGEYEGDYADGPPGHPNCRCTEGISA